jgi:hypothetical protein
MSFDVVDMIKAEIRKCEREREYWQNLLVEVTDPAFHADAAKTHAPIPPNRIDDPTAKSMTDLVTPKQLGMIRALAREAKVDADEECRATFNCRTEELSKRAASSFIDHLKNIQSQERRAS